MNPIPRVLLHLLNHMAQKTEKSSQQARFTAQSFLVLGTTQTYQVFKSFSKWAGITHASNECVISKIQIGKICIVPSP